MPGAVRQAWLASEACAAATSGVAPTEAQQIALDAIRNRPAKIRERAAKRIADEEKGYLESLGDNAAGFLGNLATCATSGHDFEIVGAMLLGMGLFKTGFLTGRSRRRVYALTAVCGYAISTPIILLGLDHVFDARFSMVSYMKWLRGPIA